MAYHNSSLLCFLEFSWTRNEHPCAHNGWLIGYSLFAHENLRKKVFDDFEKSIESFHPKLFLSVPIGFWFLIQAYQPLGFELIPVHICYPFGYLKV